MWAPARRKNRCRRSSCDWRCSDSSRCWSFPSSITDSDGQRCLHDSDCRRPNGHFHGSVCARAASDVCRRTRHAHRHTARPWLVVGAVRSSPHTARLDLEAARRGTVPATESCGLRGVSNKGEVSPSAIHLVRGSSAMPDLSLKPNLIPLHAWLIEAGTRDIATETLFDGFCARLSAAGVPIARGFLSVAGLHPVRRAYSLTWGYGRIVEDTDFEHP